VHPLWSFLLALVVGLGAAFALQVRWARARAAGVGLRERWMAALAGWVAGLLAGAAVYGLAGAVLPAAPHRDSAILAAVFGLAAYTLAAGFARRAAGGPAAYREAAIGGALQLAVLVSLPLAALLALYWLFGN
jgi:hypothetical protein